MSKPHPSIIKQAEQMAAENPKALITLINIRGEFQYISENSVKITGYTLAEAFGRPFAEFVNPEDAPSLYMAAQNTLLNERSPDTTMRVKKKQGGELLMHGHAVKLLDPKTGDAYLLAQAYVVK